MKCMFWSLKKGFQEVFKHLFHLFKQLVEVVLS